MPESETDVPFGIDERTSSKGNMFYKLKNKAGEVYIGNCLKGFEKGDRLRIEWTEGNYGNRYAQKAMKVGNGAQPTSYKRASASDEDRERMWVQGLTQQGIASGQVSYAKNSIVAAGRTAREAYKELFGPIEVQSAADIHPDDMDEDKVPY